MQEYLRVGVISTTHGVRGEVKVYPTTDDPERFRELKKVILDTGKEPKDLKGMDLLISRADAVPLGENENYIGDLIDMSVVTDTGETLGTLTDVMKTGANDVYVVKTDQGEEILLPAIRDCILDVNVEERRMLVHVLEGLLDL